MFSLQQLFGKGDKFFDLLEASADEARSSVQALVRIIKSSGGPPTLEDFVLSRRKEKRIAEELAVMFDTAHTLELTEESLALDDPKYPTSWLD